MATRPGKSKSGSKAQKPVAPRRATRVVGKRSAPSVGKRSAPSVGKRSATPGGKWPTALPATHELVASIGFDSPDRDTWALAIADLTDGRTLFRTGGRRATARAAIAKLATHMAGVEQWRLNVDLKLPDSLRKGTAHGRGKRPGHGEGGTTTPHGDPNPKGIFNLPLSLRPGDTLSIVPWERNVTTFTMNAVRLHVSLQTVAGNASFNMVAPSPTSGWLAAPSLSSTLAASAALAPGSTVGGSELFLHPSSGASLSLPPQGTVMAMLSGWTATGSGTVNIKLGVLFEEMEEVMLAFPVNISSAP